jgi:hypothetical protein
VFSIYTNLILLCIVLIIIKIESGGVKMFNTLSYIGRKLNEAGVVWAVGASLLLNHYGLVDKPNDIDILVDIKDIEKADEVLKNLGQKKQWEKADSYSTRYFYEYIIDGFDVDVMSGLRISHNNGVFEYTFDQSSLSEFKKINEIDIPLASLEDWYVIYQLIPNREAKVKLIENYLLSNGIKRLVLLERALEGDLPIEIKHRIEKLLNL